MATKKRIDLGGGFIISVESDGPVPDTTTDAGPDTIELHENAQKPETDPGAEYDAAEHVDVPEDVEKANESTFFGIILKHRSKEAFAKTKGVFPNAEAFFKSNECKQAIGAAKQWAEKHKMSFAGSGDCGDTKKVGFSTKTIAGATLAYLSKKNRLIVDILFKNAKGKVVTKKFASVKIETEKATTSESAPASPTHTVSRKPSVKSVLTKEADDPVDNAFAETTDDPPAESPPAESPAESEPQISDDEIDVEAEGTESYIAAIGNVLRSREEADAAVSNIDDSEITEVVGDKEGDSVEEAADVPPAEPPPAPDLGEDSEEMKAIESFLNSFYL